MFASLRSFPLIRRQSSSNLSFSPLLQQSLYHSNAISKQNYPKHDIIHLTVKDLITSLTVRNESYHHHFQQLSLIHAPIRHILPMIEILQSGVALPNYNLEEIFNEYDELIKKGTTLHPWEKFTLAAGLHWYAGNYLHAGILFENALEKSPFDPLLLKLAQDCYRMSGLSNQVFGCISRYPHTLSYEQTFRPTAIAFLSFGYLETFRFEEAEEYSNRAVAMSGYRDLTPLLSLCTSFYFLGKVTDMTEYYDKYSAYFTTGDTRFQLTCLRGHAMIMRGNNHGAFNCILDILESVPIAPKSTENESSPPILSFPVFLDIIFLFWHINIHLTPKHILSIDVAVNELLDYLFKYTTIPSDLKYFCEAVLLTIKLNGYETKNTKAQISLEEKASEAMARNPDGSEKSAFSKIFSGFLSKKIRRSERNETETMPVGLTVDEDDYMLQVDKVSYDELSTQEIHQLRTKLREFRQSFERNVTEEQEKRASVLSKFSSLRNIQSSLGYLPYSNTISAEKYEKAISERHQFYINAIKAILSFGFRDYKETALHLGLEAGFDFKSSGLSAIHRDLFQQTFIESLIRSGDLVGARALLLERTMTVPNDGQSWVRLARVYRLLGDPSSQDQAQRIAHQLGVGQGGFGGSI